jgi:hypothetical protein
MKKLFLLLILSFFSTQGLAAGCPDGSEPVQSVSADGTYFVYNCGQPAAPPPAGVAPPPPAAAPPPPPAAEKGPAPAAAPTAAPPPPPAEEGPAPGKLTPDQLTAAPTADQLTPASAPAPANDGLCGAEGSTDISDGVNISCSGDVEITEAPAPAPTRRPDMFSTAVVKYANTMTTWAEMGIPAAIVKKYLKDPTGTPSDAINATKAMSVAAAEAASAASAAAAEGAETAAETAAKASAVSAAEAASAASAAAAEGAETAAESAAKAAAVSAAEAASAADEASACSRLPEGETADYC